MNGSTFPDRETVRRLLDLQAKELALSAQRLRITVQLAAQDMDGVNKSILTALADDIADAALTVEEAALQL